MGSNKHNPGCAINSSETLHFRGNANWCVRNLTEYSSFSDVFDLLVNGQRCNKYHNNSIPPNLIISI